MNSIPVHVSVTPDGFGDAVKDVNGTLSFVKPWETIVPFNSYITKFVIMIFSAIILI
jgi:hypothetical protein